MARGNIEKRGDGRYRIRIYLGKLPDGTPNVHRETIRGTEVDAERRLTAVLRELDTNTYVEQTKLTLGEFLTQWMDEWVSATGKSPTTIANYKDNIEYIVPRIGHIPLQRLTPRHIQAHYAQQLKSGGRRGGGLSPTTVNGQHRVLHAALEIAVRWGLIARNVADAVQPPPRKRRAGDTWTDEQVAQFLAHIREHRLYALYVLAMTTGLRRSELGGLRWIDVDFGRRRVNIQQVLVYADRELIFKDRPKTDASEDYVSISAAVAAILDEHRKQQQKERWTYGTRYQDHGLVFAQPDGNRINIANLSKRAFPKLCEDAGVPRIRFHDIRHTYATRLLEQGLPITTAQRRLRHTRASTTLDIYSHPSSQAEADAAGAMDDLLPPSQEAEG